MNPTIAQELDRIPRGGIAPNIYRATYEPRFRRSGKGFALNFPQQARHCRQGSVFSSDGVGDVDCAIGQAGWVVLVRGLPGGAMVSGNSVNLVDEQALPSLDSPT